MFRSKFRRRSHDSLRRFLFEASHDAWAQRRVPRRDWHLDRLYAFAKSLGATILGARVSRYVIDLNRPPNDESLYPGQTTTSLCPTETFRGEALYREKLAAEEMIDTPLDQLLTMARADLAKNQEAFARAAAVRLQALCDPQGPYGSEI